MKKLILACSLLIACGAHAQSTDFRTITLSGTAQEVNAGYAAPRILNVVNDTTTILFLKFYDQLTIPYSTAHPVLTIMVPASSSVTINLTNLIRFKNACWIRAGKGVLDADTTWNKWKNFIPIVEITL